MKHLIYLAVLFAACSTSNSTENSNSATELDSTPPSEWISKATIYEVNLRQHTNEGTIAAFQEDLLRLKDLGVDVLWIMPMQTIGKLNRKAVGDSFVQDLANPDYDKYWGSPYSITDYTEVNPRHGNNEDFKRLVTKCHELGMKVILDWVGNHTAWDSKWVKEHPEYYTQVDGKIIHPENTDWTDVADLNYDNDEMRLEMIKSMQYWVRECDIDGFRCDVAMEVPTDFWEQARDSLERIKPLFMLAESEAHKPDQFNKAFDAYYGWEMHHIMNEVAKGNEEPAKVIEVMRNKDSLNGTHVFPMNFITNHDENSWNGTINERMGEAWKAMGVLSYALRGMPLIYTGQDAGLNHRLSFFGKDSVNWSAEGSTDYTNYYKALNQLKDNQAFGTLAPISFDEEYENKDLLIINRGENDKYRIILNLSKNSWVISGHEVSLTTGYDIVLEDNRNLVDDLNGEKVSQLGPWGYVVLKK